MVSTLSPILHTFTLLSIDPVAIHGMVGETATAVTYLRWKRKRSRNMRGVYDKLKNDTAREHQRSGSVYPEKKKKSLRSYTILNPFKHFKSSAGAYLQCHFNDCPDREYIIALHSVFLSVFLGKTNQAKKKIHTFWTAALGLRFCCFPDSCRDWIAVGSQVIYLSCCFKVSRRVPRFCKQGQTGMFGISVLLCRNNCHSQLRQEAKQNSWLTASYIATLLSTELLIRAKTEA